MIDLYTASTPNGWKASVMLEEIGVPYTVRPISLSNGEQRTPDFLKINPNGRIPAIVDRANGDFAVFESGAILLYLGKKSGKLLPKDEKGESRVTQWLMFQMGGIGPMMGQANVFYRYFPEKLPSAIERYHKECRRLFEVLEGQLKGREYLCDEYSIADIANWCWVRIHRWSGRRRHRPRQSPGMARTPGSSAGLPARHRGAGAARARGGARYGQEDRRSLTYYDSKETSDMLRYHTFDEIKADPGLRIVLVQGMPSPWGQAAKTIFEVKGLEYKAAPWIPFAANDAIAGWGGEPSAPIVAWANERPVHRWIDILNLAERLAPSPALVPTDADERVLMFGLSNEICGERGIGWNRRLQIVSPAIESGAAPENIKQMSVKYRYNDPDVRAAASRIAEALGALARQLESQYARGREFFVGDRLSALDIYWTAFANLLNPLPPAQCPMPEQLRPGFVARDPEIKSALSPLLLRHRDAIFEKHFRDPMEF